MKKTLMIALLCLPMAMMAQERGGAVTKPGADSGVQATAPERSLTAEVYVKTVNGRESCQIKLGSSPEVTFKNDKFVMAKFKELTTSRYQNVVDALNALTQLGFEIETSYAVMMGSTQEVHIFLTKPGIAGRGAVRDAAEGEEESGTPGASEGRRKRK